MHSFTGQTLLRRSAYAQQSVGSLKRPLMWYTERCPSALGGMWVLGVLEMICYRRNGLATLTPAQFRSENCYDSDALFHRPDIASKICICTTISGKSEKTTDVIHWKIPIVASFQQGPLLQKESRSRTCQLVWHRQADKEVCREKWLAICCTSKSLKSLAIASHILLG